MSTLRPLALGVFTPALVMALIPIPVAGFQEDPAAGQHPVSQLQCLRGDARAKTYYGHAILKLANDLENFYVFRSVGAWYTLKFRGILR